MSTGTYGDQSRVPDLQEQESQAVVKALNVYIRNNFRPLQEQYMFLTIEQSVQSLYIHIF